MGTFSRNAGSSALVLWSAIGFLLLLDSAMLSGMAEGPDLGFAIFGSPFSIFGLPILVPLVWCIFGALMSGGHRIGARRLLIVHTAAAPIAVLSNLRYGSVMADLGVQMRMMREEPIAGILLVLLYVAGYMWAWVVALREDPHGRTPDHAGA